MCLFIPDTPKLNNSLLGTNDDVLVMFLPEELSLSFFHHFEAIEVDDAVVLLVSEADEIGNAGVDAYGVELEASRYFKLLR